MKFGMILGLGKDSFSSINISSSEYYDIESCYKEVLIELRKWEKHFPQIVTPKIKMLEDMIK